MGNARTSIPINFLWHPVHFFALGFGAGCMPKMPGTFGTLSGVLVYALMGYTLSPLVYIAAATGLFLLGIWLCGVTARDLKTHDHPGIVWDEIVGYLVAMICVPFDWRFMVAGFVLFRWFDVWKPWPANWVDHKVSGGLGIMADDLIAGLYALAILQIGVYLL